MAFISNDPKKNQKVVNSQVLADGGAGNPAQQQSQEALQVQQDRAAPIPSQAPRVNQAKQAASAKPSSGTFTNVQQY